MNGREWRVVVIGRDGDVERAYGWFTDEAVARRILMGVAPAGAVLQHQDPPTYHPWITVEDRP